MTNRPPAPDNRQRGNGHPGTAATGWSAADSPDARQARLTAFWALVLRRFRDYASRYRPGAGPDRPADEEDR